MSGSGRVRGLCGVGVRIWSVSCRLRDKLRLEQRLGTDYA